MVKKAIRPAIFTWRQTEPELILCAVRWYLRDSLSFRDGEERLRERGLEADPTTNWRWVQHDGPDLEERLRRHLKPTNRSWRVDETDVCVRGRWGSRSRALDSAGATIDFARSGWREALLRKSKLAPSAPTRRFRHRSIAHDSGRPSSVIRLSTLHAPIRQLALRESDFEVDRRESTCTGRTRSRRGPVDDSRPPSSTDGVQSC